MITRNSPGIPGKPRNGDGFGSSIASGDFDRDGYADLAVSQATDYASKTEDVLIVYGGRSGLTSRVVKLKGSGDLTVAEFGRKGRPDLVVLGNAGYLLYQDVGAKPKRGQEVSFGVPRHTGSGEYPVTTVLADFTGDGYTDLVLIRDRRAENRPFQRLTLRRGSAKGLGPERRSGTASPGTTITGDFNADGIRDLIVQTGPGGISFFAGGRKGFAEPVPVAPGVGRRSAEFGQFALVKGDINGDKVPDLAIGDHGVPTSLEYASGAVTVLYGGKGFLAFKSAQYFPADTPGFGSGDFSVFGNDIALRDLNGDRRADLTIVTDDFCCGDERTIAIPSVNGRLDRSKVYEL